MRLMRTTTEILRGLLAAGLSQTEIARRTGIPQPRLSRWAAGEVPASADDVLRLVQLHGELAVTAPPENGAAAEPAAA